MNEKQKATQFGGARANAQSHDMGYPTGSKIRVNYHRLACLEIDVKKLLKADDDTAAVATLAEKLAGRGRIPTGGHYLAARQYWKALKGYEAATTRIEDAVDGRLAESVEITTRDDSHEKLSPEMSRAVLEEMTRIARKFNHATTEETI